MSPFAPWPRLRHDRRGTTAIEFALIAGLISIVIISAMLSAGQTMQDLYGRVEAAVETAGRAGDN